MFDPEKYTFAKTEPKALNSPWWIGHIPFAFELMQRLAPQTVVELGTYSGSSYFAFCQAAKELGLSTKCYGVDLWEGDIHMGDFEEALYKEVVEYVAKHYPDIGVLVRRYFDDAAGEFDAKSIDLLHIDGTHTLEAVSNDYHTWLPKMSDRGVILFHDTNVNYQNAGEKAADFKVKEFFDSVKNSFPHIEFTHCYGLGVLLVGVKASDSVREMFEDAQYPAFKEYFEGLGERVSQRFEDEKDSNLEGKIAAYIATPNFKMRAGSYLKRILSRMRNTTFSQRKY